MNMNKIYELIGFSKGSAIGLRMGEKFGIDTTNFNPFLGKGLIGKNKGDLVEIKTPAGIKNFEIKDVQYI